GVPCQALAAGTSPWQAILEATRPYARNLPALGPLGTPVNLFLIFATVLAVSLDGAAVAMVRVWNPAREEGKAKREKGGGTASAAVDDSPKTTRKVWDNPIIWREMRTWAYGRKMLVVRLAYLVLFSLAAGSLYMMHGGGRAAADGPLVLAALILLSLVLVNAQAVTALTSERDSRALDLLLVTDLTPKEIVFGKLGGILYNTKEMVLLPMLLCAGLWLIGALSLLYLIYVLVGLTVLYAFVAMLGMHAGMSYGNSGAAVASSLGTVFFLLIGVAVCMRIMMAFSGSFGAQLLPFATFMVFGGVGLYAVLGTRNPSTAIGTAALLCPFATFYAITSYLMTPPSPLAALLAIAAAYGFTTAAMLVPAIYEFDVATGRTTADE
ncbi:MAG: hypothetical protein JW959_11415, partial [Pirellulales bacterium]|nr:hypothetical protein [Pirellulales bacterium]